MDKMIDFHLHPNYSIDSAVSARAIADAALQKHLRTICYTTHIDLNPKRVGLDPFMVVNGRTLQLSDETVKKYIGEVSNLKREFAGKLEIWLGFEFSYAPHYADAIESFIERYPANFFLGAVHCLENIGVTSSGEAAGYFRSVCARDAAAAFVAATESLVRSGLFRTVAHIDGIKKYARRFYGDELEKELIRLFPPVFETMAKLGVGIEINTAAYRRGFDEPYPSVRLLESAREAGVKVNSLGSDAHRLEEVGADLEKALDIIREVRIAVGEPLAGRGFDTLRTQPPCGR